MKNPVTQSKTQIVLAQKEFALRIHQFKMNAAARDAAVKKPIR